MKRKQWHYKWGPRYIRETAWHTIGCGQVESHLNGATTVRFITAFTTFLIAETFRAENNDVHTAVMIKKVGPRRSNLDPTFSDKSPFCTFVHNFVFLKKNFMHMETIVCFPWWVFHVTCPINLAIVDDCWFFTLFW